MNTLSAIRPAGVPGLQPSLPPDQPGVIPPNELQQLSETGLAQPASGATETPRSFVGLLGQLVGDVNAKQMASNQAVNGLLSGQNVSLHQAMIAMEEASVSFQLMVEVRNKLLETYQELMRMQV
jgi:flagellar hook-basal body complex protein FliE